MPGTCRPSAQHQINAYTDSEYYYCSEIAIDYFHHIDRFKVKELILWMMTAMKIMCQRKDASFYD